MGRARTAPASEAQQAQQPSEATPIQELEQTPEATGQVAAALALAASGAGAAIASPLVAQALLTAHAGELAATGAMQSAVVAAYVASLGLSAPLLPPQDLPALQPTGRQRREVYASGLARAGYVRELLNRARYVRAAFMRGLRARRDGEDAYRRWRAQEGAWHAAHVRAVTRRQAARRRNDVAAGRYGRILGWDGVDDASTTLDCREMFGKNFDVTRPPARGIPGTVHAFCRCIPVAPYPNAEVVYA